MLVTIMCQAIVEGLLTYLKTLSLVCNQRYVFLQIWTHATAINVYIDYMQYSSIFMYYINDRDIFIENLRVNVLVLASLYSLNIFLQSGHFHLSALLQNVACLLQSCCDMHVFFVSNTSLKEITH